MDLEDLDNLLDQMDVSLFDYQESFLTSVMNMTGPQRVCLYYKTGAGKTFTALLGMTVWGYHEVLVIAPPSTHPMWEELGEVLNTKVTTMSHAKFRMKDTKVSRTMPVIADEFHLFGGQQGKGWRKLDQLAMHLKAPLILMSATPNYNDAERVYCVQHILSPHVTKGGYLQFLYENCRTEQNPFSNTPLVHGFKDYPNAATFLADLPRVYYVPDDLVYQIEDQVYLEELPDEMLSHGYNRRDHQMMASQMEFRHTARFQGIVGTDGYVRPNVLALVRDAMARPGGVLIFAEHSTIANALSLTFWRDGVDHEVVTGATSKPNKAASLGRFVRGETRVLIGTASLATGTDGMDKVCDTLVILDDTADDSLRRQLVGRIMPRGNYVSQAKKEVLRLKPV